MAVASGAEVVRKWNERYRRGRKTPLRDSVVRFSAFASLGEALDMACGTGTNSIYLAEKGFKVTGVDISREAIKVARVSAKRKGLSNVVFKVLDLAKFSFKPERYSLIVCTYFLDRSLFSRMKRSLKRGGLLIYETYNENYLRERPDFNRDYLLKKGELLKAFGDMEVLFYDDTGNVTLFIGVRA